MTDAENCQKLAKEYAFIFPEDCHGEICYHFTAGWGVALRQSPVVKELVEALRFYKREHEHWKESMFETNEAAKVLENYEREVGNVEAK